MGSRENSPKYQLNSMKWTADATYEKASEIISVVSSVLFLKKKALVFPKILRKCQYPVPASLVLFNFLKI